MKMPTKIQIKDNIYCFRCSFFKLILFYKLLKGFPDFEIRKNLDLRKILGVTNIFLESRFVIPVKVHVVNFSLFFSGISLHQYRSIWIPTRSCSKCGIENSPRILKRTFQWSWTYYFLLIFRFRCRNLWNWTAALFPREFRIWWT